MFGPSTCCAVGTNSVILIQENLFFKVYMLKQVRLQHAPALWKCYVLHSVPMLWNSGTCNLFFHLPPCYMWRCIPTEFFFFQSVVIYDDTFLCFCMCSTFMWIRWPFSGDLIWLQYTTHSKIAGSNKYVRSWCATSLMISQWLASDLPTHTHTHTHICDLNFLINSNFLK